jgi:hypothetical protein
MALGRHARWLRNDQSGKAAFFARADLRGFDFRGRDLTGTSFEGCDLRSARLQHCNLSLARLDYCDLRGADLSNVTAAVVDFHGSDLRGADLRGLSSELLCNFAGADLRGARMEGMHLRGSNFSGAWVSEADLRGARCEEETLSPRGARLGAPVEPSSDLAGPKGTPDDRALPPEYELGSGPALLDRLEAAQHQLNHKLLGDVLAGADHVRIENSPHAPLVVERLQGARFISMYQCRERAGDTHLTTEVVFLVENGRAKPVYYRHDSAGSEYATVGGHFVDVPVRPQYQGGLEQNVRDWWRDLEYQGFFQAASRLNERGHEHER